MARRFDYFVLLAEMRTGSNHLEESLNAAADIKCYGELFNPGFIGHHNLTSLFDVSMAARDTDPQRLIHAMRSQTPGLPGFRYFHDHDPRVYQGVMDDPRCAKIILTRDPLDSFVSLEIARHTGQWRLVNAGVRKTAKITFDPQAYEQRCAVLGAFQTKVQRQIQITGQTAFALRYEDICDLEVINGLIAWLGSDVRLEALPGRLLKQNPSRLADKVENHEELQTYLQEQGANTRCTMPVSESPGLPGVPRYLVSDRQRLLIQPVAGSANDTLAAWLNAVDGAPPVTGFSQKMLRRWMRHTPGFTSLTVVRHPLLRAYSAFLDLMHGEVDDNLGPLRHLFQERLVSEPRDEGAVFAKFLSLVAEVLDGGTRLHPPPGIATQASVIQGFSQVHPPHRILRESDASDALAQIARGAAFVPRDGADLDTIYTAEHEKIAAKIYRRDYVMFGFDRWRA